ncbi:unnamed protein product [Brachionus calyciflorus]|uniref:Uncharacterized protein n=1 Tax=Brachionus calyciflorus TaxID=104777 RepID=A0A814LXQ4_9BILA|nr:unnamed protein product [Brachionus calyciflorus]
MPTHSDSDQDDFNPTFSNFDPHPDQNRIRNNRISHFTYEELTISRLANQIDILLNNPNRIFNNITNENRVEQNQTSPPPRKSNRNEMRNHTPIGMKFEDVWTNLKIN